MIAFLVESRFSFFINSHIWRCFSLREVSMYEGWRMKVVIRNARPSKKLWKYIIVKSGLMLRDASFQKSNLNYYNLVITGTTRLGPPTWPPPPRPSSTTCPTAGSSSAGRSGQNFWWQILEFSAGFSLNENVWNCSPVQISAQSCWCLVLSLLFAKMFLKIRTEKWRYLLCGEFLKYSQNVFFDGQVEIFCLKLQTVWRCNAVEDHSSNSAGADRF